jgi:hypothetical protein
MLQYILLEVVRIANSECTIELDFEIECTCVITSYLSLMFRFARGKTKGMQGVCATYTCDCFVVHNIEFKTFDHHYM